MASRSDRQPLNVLVRVQTPPGRKAGVADVHVSLHRHDGPDPRAVKGGGQSWARCRGRRRLFRLLLPVDARPVAIHAVVSLRNASDDGAPVLGFATRFIERTTAVGPVELVVSEFQSYVKGRHQPRLT